MVVLKGGSTCSRPIVSLTSITTSASRAPCTPPIHPPAISVWPNFRHTRGELTLTMTPKYIGLGQFPSALLISIAGHSFQFIRMNLLALFASFEYRQPMILIPSLYTIILTHSSCIVKGLRKPLFLLIIIPLQRNH